MSSSDASFDAMAYARQDLTPILVQMIALTKKEGQLEQAYYFENLHKALEEADNQGDLIEVFFNLSAANFLGFDYAASVAILLDQLLEKAELLSESQMVSLSEKH